MLRARIGALTLVGLIVAAYFAFSMASGHGQNQAAAEQAVVDAKILLVSANESNPLLASRIQDLETSGFTVTSDAPSAVSQLLGNAQIAAFLVTRSAFDEVPSSVWSELYAKGTMIGGLDMSLYELQPLAIPGSSIGSGRLKYTPSRPIFSLILRSGCGRSLMSDWLDNWHLGDLIQYRLANLPTDNSCSAPVGVK